MKKAVLLINLGTPDTPAVSDVRKYLTQFLNDPRVIDINAAGRFFLVNGVIVPFRSSKSAKLYKHIWTAAGSPLSIHTKNLASKLQTKLGGEVIVEWAMRYQNPSIKSVLDKLRRQKVSEITILPLYPQYASSSTGSTAELVLKELASWEVIPSTKIINKFYDNPHYINALLKSAEGYDLNFYDHILFSYHGLPERQIKKASTHYGDNSCHFGNCCDVISEKNQYCYRANCMETTRQLVKHLNIPNGKYTSTFQSRLDDVWLKPYSDKVLAHLAKNGAKKVLVFSPAFVADCLETIHEIGTEYNEIFKENGGEYVTLVNSLNDNDYWVDAISKIIA